MYQDFKIKAGYTLFLEEYCFSDSGSIFLIFWRFEGENILRIFLQYRPILDYIEYDSVYTLCNILVSCYAYFEHVLSQSLWSRVTTSHQSTLGHFGFKKNDFSQRNIFLTYVCCTKLYILLTKSQPQHYS